VSSLRDHFRRQTTANPRAAVCWLCPSWFYGLTRGNANRKLTEHVRMIHVLGGPRP
jgi:hypothetical protein